MIHFSGSTSYLPKKQISLVIKIKFADQTKSIEELTPDWIRRTINRNRVMGKQSCIEIDIESESVNLKLTANCDHPTETKAANEIESRIIFLWHDLVLNKQEWEADSLFDFLSRTEEWTTFEPK